jgi:hypothetical protein
MKRKRAFLAKQMTARTRAYLARLFTPKAGQRVAQILMMMCAAMLGLIIVWFILSYLPNKNDVAGQQQPPSTQPSPPPKVLEIKKPPPGNANSTDSVNKPEAKTTEDKKDGESLPLFYTVLEKALAQRGTKLEYVCAKNDPVARRVLEDYGAMFLASGQVLPPPLCVFGSEEEVARFQEDAKFTSAVLGGARIELQPVAMEALLAARAEARKQGLDITPRGGAEAARRSYNDTVRLWSTRFLPALNYWQQRGRLTKGQAARLRQLPLQEQVGEVLELEKTGIYFSKDFSKSILYSIAAPGSSQHIAMLALDVSQFGNARVRQILARHGWFQTVKSDLPHFTYLGVEEKALPGLGLRPVNSGGQVFWIPNLEPANNENPKIKK